MLQSMAEVEKNPRFRSKQYAIVGSEEEETVSEPNSVKVALKHPDNVIVVASPTGKAPPSANGEKRVTTLTQAVHLSFMEHCLYGTSGCSIVVHEGMYINPDLSYCYEALPGKDKFSIEIVGVHDVRIVFVDTLLVFGFENTVDSADSSGENVLEHLVPNHGRHQYASKLW